MKKEDLSRIVENMPKNELAARALAWAESHEKFADFLLEGYTVKSKEGKKQGKKKLNFSVMMSDSMTSNTPTDKSRRWDDFYNEEILDWSDVYYEVIEPYEDKLEEMSTEEVADFGAAIMTTIVPELSEEDFMCDNWYADDYYGDIEGIVEAARGAVMLAVQRDDFDTYMGELLLDALVTAGENKALKSYVDGHWEDLIRLVDERLRNEEVTAELYDALADADRYDCGKWIRMKVDFLEGRKRNEEAQQVIRENDGFEEIRDLMYGRMVAEKKWDEAFELIDKWVADAKTDGRYGRNHKWEDKRLELAKQTGRKELTIKTLTEMFLERYDRDKYYKELKATVDADGWKVFYVELLKQSKQSVDAIGQFLAEEGETEWLYRLICKENKESPISYHQMITYYPFLKKEHGEDMRQRIKKAFMDNAAARFCKGNQCKNEWYESFCKSLRDFYTAGGREEVRELVPHFLMEYRSRRNLVASLRGVQQWYAGRRK